jgi:cytochrome c2
LAPPKVQFHASVSYAIPALQLNEVEGGFMNSVLKSLVAVSALALASGAAHAAGDAAKGADVFKKCKVCHEVGETAKDKVGPTLNGVIGRKIGTEGTFAYSPALKEAGEKGQTWTEENLDKYLTDPRTFMPGNKMAFAGLKKEEDRANVIAYLKQFTK